MPAQLLQDLPPGRHDISIALVAGGRRALLRLSAGPEVSLPAVWGGLRVYVTSAGNISLHRERPVPPQPSLPTFSVDARTVPEDLALLTTDLRSRLSERRALGACDLTYSFPREDSLRFDALFPGIEASVLIVRTPSCWTVSVFGRDPMTERFLRNVLVNRARMSAVCMMQMHLLEEIDRSVATSAVSVRVVEVLVNLLDRFRLFLDAGDRPQDHGLVPASWWDVKPNFGDVLGPMLIESLAGRPAINVRAFPSQDPGLFTVGSTIGHLQRPGSRIWGSGLIGPPSGNKLAALAARRPRSVHAVRGVRTGEFLRDHLGWEVPEVYGDPALLLPRYYQPRPAPATEGKIAIIPHYMHTRVLPADLPDDVAVIDVRQGPEVVIDQIVAARACVSSSLHGLVIAQAWQIPWVWLRVGDVELRGDRFKFEDFYTVLDADEVQTVDVTTAALAKQDWSAAARRARVPRSDFDADALVSAFPGA
ncbi:MAG: hypothetical protein Q4P07_13950 [Ornithinimicrobium sp.]|uniref:polysaccharide pyruvyl transferase family protein n=1 Tax=Ornithinimicrobium sp. TaxID=1977084 RepID=UPI0026DF1D32|nr:polysaccharide pyruvyl transferase family protein [Ornithinimicrobium sp.]MDO5741240.1 hypothetical protein [Ornithinimicrobium sp.]